MKPQSNTIEAHSTGKLFPRLVRVQVLIAVVATIFIVVLVLQISPLIKKKADLNADIERLNAEIKEKENAIKGLTNAVEVNNIKNPAQVIPLVYVEFEGDIKRDLIQDLRATLNNQGFPAPEAKRIEGDYYSEVRYFNPEDKRLAEDVARIAKKFFESKGCPADFPTNDLSSKARGPRGQIEIWINMNCRLVAS